MLEIFVIWLFLLFEKSSFKVLLMSLRALTDQSSPVDWRGAQKRTGGGGGGGGGGVDYKELDKCCIQNITHQ